MDPAATRSTVVGVIHRLDSPWAKFSKLIARDKVPEGSACPYFRRFQNVLTAEFKTGERKLRAKTSSIRSAVFIELGLVSDRPTDRQTDGHTETAPRHIGGSHSVASRDKNSDRAAERA